MVVQHVLSTPELTGIQARKNRKNSFSHYTVDPSVLSNSEQKEIGYRNCCTRKSCHSLINAFFYEPTNGEEKQYPSTIRRINEQQ